MSTRTMALAGLLTALMTAPAAAQEFRAVTDEGEFRALMQRGSVSKRLYNLSLNVQQDGQISGSAMGWDVTGTWSWQNGYFCREMNWGGDPIPYNCQLVEVAGPDVRFTSDQGAGDSETFRIR